MKGKHRGSANGHSADTPLRLGNFAAPAPGPEDKIESLAGRAYVEIRDKILKGDLAVATFVESLPRMQMPACAKPPVP